MNNDFVIGVLGGMGTYATIHMFSQYAEVFPAEKEFDRPRIVIDNRCTMPSRVRAFLYKENVDELVTQMAESMSNLKKSGCNRIILACNTSHLFLPEIYLKDPSLKESVVNIIDLCTEKIKNDNIKEVFLLASEGTIDSGIYQEKLAKKGVNCLAPEPEEYRIIRECIEAVKQNKYTKKTKELFLNLINRYPCCILGCTEMPILFEKYKDEIICKNVYDPLLLTLLKLREEFLNV